MSRGTSFGKSHFLKKSFSSISDIALKSFCFFSRFLERVRQNWVPRIHRKKWGQKHTFCLKMYFYNFRTMSRRFRLFVESFPPGLSKVHSSFPWNQFEGNNLWEKYILCGHWVKQFPSFCEKKTWAVLSKLHSTCPKKKFEVKYFWFTKVLFFLKTSNIERTIFCPLLDFFWQRLQNCLLRVQKKILRRMRLTKKFSVFLDIGQQVFVVCWN